MILASAGLLLALASWADYRRYAQGRDALAETLRAAGFERRAPAVIDAVIHERTLHHARLLTARALLYDVLDARPESPAPESGAEAAPEKGTLILGSPEWDAAVERLDDAAALARQALSAQAGNWEAAMLVGASTYLERSLSRDPSLVTMAADWEKPLTAAVAAAPGKSEPRRLLAGAYLELWRSLSPAKRDLTRELLASAFAEDPAAFRALAPIWLEVIEDLELAFSAIPESAAAWREVEAIYARKGHWEAFRQSRDRRLEALFLESESQLEEGARRLRLGDFFHGRSLLLQVVVRAPLEERFAPLVTRALELYPPGLHGVGSTDALRGWLRFAFELRRIGKILLPPRVIGRLASAAGDLPPAEGAFAALLSGDLAYAERFERLGETLSAPSWGPYLIAKANWLVERERIDEAAAALERVGQAAREVVDHALAEVRLARARGGPAQLAAAERRLDAYRKRSWSASEWRYQGQRVSLPLLPAAASRGVVMTVNRVSERGVVVGLYWDGRLLSLEALHGVAEVTLELPVDEGLHLLELRTVAGEPVLPGRVELLENQNG